MPKVPSEHLRTLRNDVPVLAVVSELSIPTKLRGRRLTFRCPYCDEFHTAVNERTNLARCFACERNFNPIDLVVAERCSSFHEAVQYLDGLLARYPRRPVRRPSSATPGTQTTVVGTPPPSGR